MVFTTDLMETKLRGGDNEWLYHEETADLFLNGRGLMNYLDFSRVTITVEDKEQTLSRQSGIYWYLETNWKTYWVIESQ